MSYKSVGDADHEDALQPVVGEADGRPLVLRVVTTLLVPAYTIRGHHTVCEMFLYKMSTQTKNVDSPKRLPKN